LLPLICSNVPCSGGSSRCAAPRGRITWAVSVVYLDSVLVALLTDDRYTLRADTFLRTPQHHGPGRGRRQLYRKINSIEKHFLIVCDIHHSASGNGAVGWIDGTDHITGTQAMRKGEQLSRFEIYLEDRKRMTSASLSAIERAGTEAAPNRCRALAQRIQCNLRDKKL
jgi:hypothetical protein